jgi:hypothetical protein
MDNHETPAHFDPRRNDHLPPKSKNGTCKHAWGIAALKRRTENVDRHDDNERKKSMSTKSKTSDPPVNSVVFELYDEYATTTAAHRKDRDEQRLYVRVEGGLSTKATIRGLRSLVSKLEMNGLPVGEMTDEWSPLDFVSKSGSGDRR